MAFRLSPTATPPRPFGGRLGNPTAVHVPPPPGIEGPRLGAARADGGDAFAAWAAHLDAGRIGGGAQAGAAALEGAEYGLASLERILAAGPRARA